MKFNKPLIQKYAIIPLISVVVLNALAYFVSRLITTDLFHHDITTRLDEMTPFIPFFIVFYLLAYLQWVIGYVLVGQKDKRTVYTLYGGEMIAKFMCLLVFILYPTTNIRPAITGTDIFSNLTGLIYSLDAPDNLFPSIHCLESWFCFRTCYMISGTKRPYRIGQFIMTILVFLSTIFLKQHVIADIFGGVIFLEIGFFLAKQIAKKIPARS